MKFGPGYVTYKIQRVGRRLTGAKSRSVLKKSPSALPSLCL